MKLEELQELQDEDVMEELTNQLVDNYTKAEDQLVDDYAKAEEQPVYDYIKAEEQLVQGGLRHQDQRRHRDQAGGDRQVWLCREDQS